RSVMYRRAGDVGLRMRIPMALGPLDQLDLVARHERHDRLLPARASPLEAAHALPLTPAVTAAHVCALHVEDLPDRLADLHLVGVDRHLEGDRVQVVLLLHALLRHQGTEEHRTGIFQRPSASWSCSTASRSMMTRTFRTIWYAEAWPDVSTASHG